jgi:hypothetical protein
MNPRDCPFMRSNPALLKGIVDAATTEQRASVHQLPRLRREMITKFGETPMLTAWYVVQWLTRLGQNPAHWSRAKWRGKVVPASDVLRQVLIGRSTRS